MEEYKGYYIEERWAVHDTLVPDEYVVYENQEKVTRGEYVQVFDSVGSAKNWIDTHAEIYMISSIGFDIAAVLEVFWKKLKYTSPTELELSLRDIVGEVEMTDERKESVARILQQMVTLGLVDKCRG